MGLVAPPSPFMCRPISDLAEIHVILGHRNGKRLIHIDLHGRLLSHLTPAGGDV